MSNEEYMIFYGEKDIDYTKSNNYAFLNWDFDNSRGGKNNVYQSVEDNFVMGNAYMGNAVLGLFSILYSGNYCSVADTFIFPILFDIWHGVELWLKSSVDAIYYFQGIDNKKKKNHKIHEYLEILEGELKKLSLNQTINVALPEVIKLIQELQRVKANFDFARYTFNRQGNYQFYNAPIGKAEQWQNKEKNNDGQTDVSWISKMPIVPNTCVDLQELFVIVLGIVGNFRPFVEYLMLIIDEGGKLTDTAYNNFFEKHKKVQEDIMERDNNKEDLDVVNEFQRVYKAKDENVEYEKELNAELAKLQKTRQKYMDMYTDDLISREELNEKIGGSRQEMERIENELKMVSYHLTKGEQLENILNNTFKEIEDITDVHQMTNQQLKRLIQKIEVDKEGNVDIYLRLLGDLGLDESVLIEENETVLNCDDQT